MIFFYTTSIVLIIIDFVICWIKKQPYRLKESLVTLCFYLVDMIYNLTPEFLPTNFLFEAAAFFDDFKLFRLNEVYLFLSDIFFRTREAYVFHAYDFLINLEFIKILFLFLLVDFAYYWIHRVNHEIGIIWAQHSVHHSTTQLNFLATQRNNFRFLNLRFHAFFLLIPLIFGYQLIPVLIMFGWSQLYQTVIHSEWIPRFWRPLEWVFNTPYHHRIHHSLEYADVGGNYGGTLIIFDRIFGTLIEVEDRKFTYGLKEFRPSYNPIKIHFQVWIQLLVKAYKTKSIVKAIILLFLPSSLKRRISNFGH